MHRVFISGLFLVLSVIYSEGTQWNMRDSRNMVSDAEGLPVTISESNTLWKVRLGSHQYSIPVVSEGRIFLGLNDAGLKKGSRFRATQGGLVMCLDEKTGAMLWQFPMPRIRLKGHFFDHVDCGVCSAPVIDGNRMYLVGSHGEILCMDVKGLSDGNDGPYTNELEYIGEVLIPEEKKIIQEDGDVIWIYNFINELEVFPQDIVGSTLLMHSNLLFACTSHGLMEDHIHIRNTTAPNLIVVDKRDGRLIARDRTTIAENMLHGQWSSPSLGIVDGRPLVFYGGGDGLCYAFEVPDETAADGLVQDLRIVWSRDCSLPQYRFRDGVKVSYATRHNKSPVGPSEIIGVPVFYENRVYVTAGQDPLHGPGESELTCLDAGTGTILWQSPLVGRTTCTVAISQGLLYVADYNNKMHCFDAWTGERYWFHDLEGGVWTASPLAADGKVYICTEKNRFFVFKEGQEKVLLNKQVLPSTAITPVAANGIFYLPLQNALLAIRTEATKP